MAVFAVYGSQLSGTSRVWADVFLDGTCFSSIDVSKLSDPLLPPSSGYPYARNPEGPKLSFSLFDMPDNDFLMDAVFVDGSRFNSASFWDLLKKRQSLNSTFRDRSDNIECTICRSNPLYWQVYGLIRELVHKGVITDMNDCKDGQKLADFLGIVIAGGDLTSFILTGICGACICDTFF